MLRSYGRFDLVGPGFIFGVLGVVWEAFIASLSSTINIITTSTLQAYRPANGGRVDRHQDFRETQI